MGGGPESMLHGRARPRIYARPWIGVACALTYVGLGLAVGLSVYDDYAIAPIWIAGGLTVVWMLLRGVRIWSIESALLVVAALAANLVAGASLGLAAALAGVAFVQTWTAVLLLRRWCAQLWGCGGDEPINRPRAVGALFGALFVAVGLGSLLVTLVMLALPSQLHGDIEVMQIALWFGRNVCSALITLPLGLMVGQRLSGDRPRPAQAGDGGVTELVAAAGFSAGMYALAFTFETLPLTFPLLIATVWVALRFSTAVLTGHTFLVGLAVLGSVIGDVGPFAAAGDLYLGSLLAQLYVATIAMAGLTIATGRDERSALADELRRTREEALNEERLRAAVIGSMAEGVLVIDERGELLVQNDAAARVLGLGAPMSRGDATRLVSWTLDGVRLDDSERPGQRALRGEVVRDEQLVIRGEGAEDRILTISATPLPWEGREGRARAMLLMRDTTVEHAHREELSAFAGVVAHDLRNPLAAIDGWTEMIADELDAGALDVQLAREFVSRVRSASRRMRELIRDLLAHATSSSRDLEVNRVDLAATVEDIAASRHAEGYVTAEQCPAVLGDPVLVRQVLDNLIGNAIKYVAAGEEPKIQVRGTRSDARWVTVQVVDNGIGIPEADRERVFEEFHRAHYREYEGSGLGLAIVRRIVTRHGGTIRALANPDGQGSVFEFTLPAYEGDD